LGVDRYGIFAVLASFRGLLSNLDGGLGPTAMRFLAVSASTNDRRRTSSLLFTIVCMLVVVTGAVAAIAAVLAPEIAGLIHTSAQLRHTAIELIRLFMPLGVVAAIQGAIARTINAEHRWRYLNTMNLVGGAVYAALAALFVAQGDGLFGLFWASALSQLVLLVGSLWGARRSIIPSACRLLPRAEVRDLLRYSSRVQIAAVASSFSFEIDSLIVALIFPVRYVTLYSIGSNFSTQLLSLPTNAVAPIAVTLSRTYGSTSPAETLEEFTRLQRVWVRSVAAFPIIGAACAYFAVDRWLGPRDRLAGVVAVILLLGGALSLFSQVMDHFGKSINRPELESRYLGVGVVVNIALTIPLALTIGMLGVPLGTACGATVSSVYFLHLARRKIRPDLRSFLTEVPVVALLLSVGVTLLLEVPAFRIAPRGALGLLVCAVPALAGLGVYTVATNGLRSSIQLLIDHRPSKRGSSTTERPPGD
jgi:O-antigen/teichoic acid export membrane protein